MNEDTMTMAQLLGEEAVTEMVAYTEHKSSAQVEKERRRAAFQKDLVARMDSLLAWTRGQTQEMVKVRGGNGYWTVRPATEAEACPACKAGRAFIAELAKEATEAFPPKVPHEHKGLVVFSQDIKLAADAAGVMLGGREQFPRHDQYHLEVAYTAVRKAEYEARVGRRQAAEAAREKAILDKLAKGIDDRPKGGPRNERRKGGRFLNPYGSGHWVKAPKAKPEGKKKKKA